MKTPGYKLHAEVAQENTQREKKTIHATFLRNIIILMRPVSFSCILKTFSCQNTAFVNKKKTGESTKVFVLSGNINFNFVCKSVL